MNINEYKNNPELAYAKEIFNANAKTLDELMYAISKANKIKHEFDHIIELEDEIEDSYRWLAKHDDILGKIWCFKRLPIARLGMEFIKNNNDELIKEIIREAERLDGTVETTSYSFEIRIGTFRISVCNGNDNGIKRVIVRIDDWHWFNIEDIDDRIAHEKRCLNDWEEEIKLCRTHIEQAKCRIEKIEKE